MMDVITDVFSDVFIGVYLNACTMYPAHPCTQKRVENVNYSTLNDIIMSEFEFPQ